MDGWLSYVQSESSRVLLIYTDPCIMCNIRLGIDEETNFVVAHAFRKISLLCQGGKRGGSFLVCTRGAPSNKYR